jgi:hypothetical protein
MSTARVRSARRQPSAPTTERITFLGHSAADGSGRILAFGSERMSQ